MNHYDNGQIVLNEWRGKGTKIQQIPPGEGLKIHHHVVLNPVCYRTTKDKSVAIDCRGIDSQTLQYKWVIIFFEE